MFALSVVTSVSLIGMIWFNSFQKNLYVMLNPEQATDQRLFADNYTYPSLLSSIFQAGKNMKASISNLLNIGKDNMGKIVNNQTGEQPHLLPLAGEK